MNGTKKNNWILGINPCIYGLNYHDPSAALICDGEIIVAIEEERVTGIKGSKGMFPIGAIKACLAKANINLTDVSAVAIGYSPELWKNRMNIETMHILKNSSFINIKDYVQKGECVDSEPFIKQIIDSNLVNRYEFFKDTTNVVELILKNLDAKDLNIRFYEHHESHISSAYFTSGFNEALGVVVDGVGEYSTTTLWEIKKGIFSKVLDIPMPNSLGYFYAAATAFLGFEPWQGEGKLMALAAYGQKNESILEKMKKIISIEQEIYDVSEFINRNMGNYLMLDLNKAIEDIGEIVGIKPRKKEELNNLHKEFAWAVQYCLEKAVTNIVNYGVEKTGISNVCAAGGVFLNCKMNMIIRENSKAEDFFVQPIASDAGLSIGAALLEAKECKNGMTSLALGPSYSDEEIEKILLENKLSYNKSSDVAKDVAEMIAQGKIICWFQGNLEMGARALGSRSILADPRKRETSDYLNTYIKHRETWRPFACSMLEEFAPEVLEDYKVGSKYPYMIEAFRVKENWKDKIPAVIHRADGTTRPQTIDSKSLPLYHNMVRNFMDLTGIPLILNTSFNDKGQPIIMHPNDAIKFYLSNPVDALVLGSYILLKK